MWHCAEDSGEDSEGAPVSGDVEDGSDDVDETSSETGMSSSDGSCHCVHTLAHALDPKLWHHRHNLPHAQERHNEHALV